MSIFSIVGKNEIIEQILSGYKQPLENDLIKYSNHVQRVYQFCTLLDPESDHPEKYAIASAFHDLGIWTHNTFDYLRPSISLARDWLLANNKKSLVAEISLMIEMHHKLTRYNGRFSTVETFRKADWIDLTLGLFKFGIDRNHIQKIMRRFPTKGFHRFLILESSKNLLRNPFRPLPMFRR